MTMEIKDRLYIGGEWVAPAGTDTIEVISPTIVLLTDAETKAADPTSIDLVYSLNSIDARDVPNQKMGSNYVQYGLGLSWH